MRPPQTFGAAVRALRGSVSLASLASRACLSRAYLGHLETGRRPPTRDAATALDAALGTAGLLVALAESERQGDDVRRREALAGIVALLAGAPTTLETVLRAGIESAMSDDRDPDDWQSRAERLGADYMTTPGTELQDRLARDLALLQHRLTTPDMWAVAARLLAVYGKTQRDPVTATRWYRLAADAADRSGRDDIRVWVRGRTALALGYEGALPPVALEMADQALAVAGDRPSLGSLQAHMARAHVFGIRGDRAGAMEALGSAERAFDSAGSDDQISDFAVPEWRMRTFTSMLLSRLGDPRAMREQDRADRYRSATLPRFATHIEMHRGLMLVRSGDIRGGREYARAALDRLPPERRSLTLRLLMAEIEGRPTSGCPKE